MGYATEHTAAMPVAEALMALWRENLHLDGDPAHKLRWFYQEAPAGPGSAVVLRHDGTIVGAAGIGARVFWDGELRDERRVALLADLAVARAHRTLMPALMLLRAVRAAAGEGLRLGFPNDKAVGLFKRLGFQIAGKMTRHVVVLRHGRYLRRLLESPRAAGLLGVAADAVRLALAGARAARHLAGHALVWPEAGDERFDRLWLAARRAYPFVGRRDAAFLDWRVRRRPGRGWRIAALESRADRSLAAYAVVEEDGERAHLRDLFGLDRGALLDLLLPALWARGAAAVSFRFLGGGEIDELLAARGFVPREAVRDVVCEGDAPPAQSWYLTDVDEDN